MFWRLEESSWLLEQWSFLWADSVLSMEKDARIILLSLKGIAILLCPKLKNLPHGSVILAWTNNILNKIGTEETTFGRLPSSEPACLGLSFPFLSWCWLFLFCYKISVVLNGWYCQTSPERVSLNCLLLYLCLALTWRLQNVGSG